MATSICPTLTKVRPLLTISYPGSKTVFHRLDAMRYEIGRSSSCSIRIVSQHVSRHQAVLMQDKSGRYQVWDGNGLGVRSTNGTFVNGIQIDRCYLNSGDIIYFGSEEVTGRFYQDNKPPSVEDDSEEDKITDVLCPR
jgi:pSer/pThr/pTyr-binding forkhead associated (FHA) protein